MKLFLFVLVFLASGLASATTLSGEPFKLLSYSTSNGSVAPAYQVRTSCDIFNNVVMKTTRKGGVTYQPVYADVKWSAEVPNAEEVLALVLGAKNGVVKHGIGPVGGGSRMYTGFIPTQSENGSVILRGIGGANYENQTTEAAVLVRFIDQNCQ